MSDLDRNPDRPPTRARLADRLGLSTWAGRLILLSSALWALTAIGAATTTLPPFIDLLGRVARVAWFVGLAALGLVAAARHRRALLWRVRRKLLLSYVFLGVVPVVLVLAFALATGVLLHVTVASYVFQQGYERELEDVTEAALASGAVLGRITDGSDAILERRVDALDGVYPGLSMAVVPLSGSLSAVDGPVAGAWGHADAPLGLPGWTNGRIPLAATAVVRDERGGALLVLRAVAPTADRRHAVVVDLPLDAAAQARLAARTGATIADAAVNNCGVEVTPRPPPVRTGWSLFEETVAFIECTAWETGARGRVSLSLTAPVGVLYTRLAAANADTLSWSVLVQLLVVLAILFLIIQGSALVMGAILARSITSAVHELFEGTERVRRGDFAHRIAIDSRDQLGDLAASFNRMSASVEHLLHVQREKQRLDDELRIARDIQKSLLPKRPPSLPGLDIADLCEPAREVGGDYYDFFAVGPRQLAVLVADVSGKGTSAALYMAELKGLMLALSQTASSPRQLLIDLNHRLVGHLDQRSFITMTYAVIDLDRMTLTVARAGHTPLIAVRDGMPTLVAPSGLVLGLSMPGAEAKFAELLAEHTQTIAAGDIFVFYTDGVTEATDAAGDLFGDAALARVVAAQQSRPAAAIRERVLRDVQAFVGTTDPHDDMTMVIVKVTDGLPAGEAI